MSKVKIILIAAFVVTLAAGLVGGFALASASYAKRQKDPVHEPERGHDFFKELNMTPEQNAKFREIWSKFRSDSGKLLVEQRPALQKERDDTILALLGPEQKAKFDDVQKTYATKLADLTKQREKMSQDAVEEVNKILNDEQRKTYKELREKWQTERHPGGSVTPQPVKPGESNTFSAPKTPAKSEEHAPAGAGT